MDGRTDGRTDTQKFGGYNIIPRHFLWRGIKMETKMEVYPYTLRPYMNTLTLNILGIYGDLFGKILSNPEK